MAPLYFYLWFILKLTLVTGQPALYALKGREAILTPALNKLPDDILWKHNGDKVITFDGAEERVFEPYHGRVTLAWDTAKLTISDVRYEDSGEFELDAISGERLYRSQYMLKVLDKVSKPVITCEMNDENSHSNIPSATLFCSSPSNTPEALTFMWNLEGKSELSQNLPITLGNGHDDITYSCTANNPLQEETSTFMAKDCYTERTSEPLNIVVPIIIASLILLAFCIFPIIFRHQIKRVFLNMRKNDDCEKQLKAAVQKQDESDKMKDEHDPLLATNIHRQETMLSSQRLLQQEYVTEQTQGRVKNIREIFEIENAETFPGKGNDTGEGTSPSSSFPKPAPDPGQMDSGGEMDLQHKDLNNVPITVENGDTDCKHADEDENEDAPLESQSPSSEPQVNQDIKFTLSEQGSSIQTESEKQPDEHHKDHDDEQKTDANESTKAPEQTEPPSSEPQVNQDINTMALEQGSSVQTESEKQPDEHHKDKDDEQKMEAPHSSNSTETGPDESTKALEEIDVPPTKEGQTELNEEENNEPMKDPINALVSNSTTTAPDHPELPQAPLQSNESPDRDEPGSTDQTNADADLDTDQMKKGPLSDDPSNNSSQISPVSSEPQSPSSESQVNQDIKTVALEQKSSVQIESEKQPDKHHKDKDDEQKMEVLHSSNSTETGPDESTKALEEIDVPPTNEGQTELNEVTNPNCTENSEPLKDPKDVPVSNQTTTAADHPVAELAQLPPPNSAPSVEPGSSEQTNADTNLDTDAVTKGPLSDDPSNNEGRFNSSQMSQVSSVGSGSTEQTNLDADSNIETEDNDPQNEPFNKEISVSQPQSSQSESDESEDKKKSDGEESNTASLEKNPQRDSDQGSGTSDDKGTEETSQPQNEPLADTQHSETSASPEPGMGQTLPTESSSVENSPRNSSENNAEKTATPESEKTVSVSQPQSSQSESDESEDKKKNDGEELNTAGLEKNPQSDSDQGSGTLDDKGTEETSQPQNETPETLRSETPAPPEPGKDQTPESSSVEGKGHDKSNTETQKQDSPCNSSEDNPQKTVTAESEKTGSNEQNNKSPNPPVSPPSQTTDDDKVNKNTGEGAEDDKKEKKDETDKESGSSGSEQSSGDIPG